MSTISLMEKGLELAIDGDSAYFNYFWLRDNCSTSWETSTQERIFNILAEPDDLQPQCAQLNGRQLEIIWRNGHRSSYGSGLRSSG